MSKYILTKVKVKKLSSKLTKGDYVEYNGKVYLFEGWDYGTYPICRDLETNEQVQIPHY